MLLGSCLGDGLAEAFRAGAGGAMMRGVSTDSGGSGGRRRPWASICGALSAVCGAVVLVLSIIDGNTLAVITMAVTLPLLIGASAYTWHQHRVHQGSV